MTFITHTTMIAEEKYLEDKYGKKQPFKVPNGYFDSFADNLMDKLPEQQPAASSSSFLFSLSNCWQSNSVFCSGSSVGVVVAPRGF